LKRTGRQPPAAQRCRPRDAPPIPSDRRRGGWKPRSRCGRPLSGQGGGAHRPLDRDQRRVHTHAGRSPGPCAALPTRRSPSRLPSPRPGGPVSLGCIRPVRGPPHRGRALFPRLRQPGRGRHWRVRRSRTRRRLRPPRRHRTQVMHVHVRDHAAGGLPAGSHDLSIPAPAEPEGEEFPGSFLHGSRPPPRGPILKGRSRPRRRPPGCHHARGPQRPHAHVTAC
jgi:hypothetical protein